MPKTHKCRVLKERREAWTLKSSDLKEEVRVKRKTSDAQSCSHKSSFLITFLKGFSCVSVNLWLRQQVVHHFQFKSPHLLMKAGGGAAPPAGILELHQVFISASQTSLKTLCPSSCSQRWFY